MPLRMGEDGLLHGEALYHNPSSDICVVPGQKMLRGQMTIDTKKALSQVKSKRRVIAYHLLALTMSLSLSLPIGKWDSKYFKEDVESKMS